MIAITYILSVDVFDQILHLTFRHIICLECKVFTFGGRELGILTGMEVFERKMLLNLLKMSQIFFLWVALILKDQEKNTSVKGHARLRCFLQFRVIFQSEGWNKVLCYESSQYFTMVRVAVKIVWHFAGARYQVFCSCSILENIVYGNLAREGSALAEQGKHY